MEGKETKIDVKKLVIALSSYMISKFKGTFRLGTKYAVYLCNVVHCKTTNSSSHPVSVREYSAFV